MTLNISFHDAITGNEGSGKGSGCIEGTVKNNFLTVDGKIKMTISTVMGPRLSGSVTITVKGTVNITEEIQNVYGEGKKGTMYQLFFSIQGNKLNIKVEVWRRKS